MSKVQLTEEEKGRLIEAINNGVEPDPDLLPKIFPGTSEKYDIHSLDRARIPTLEYAGKRTKAAILAEGGAGIGAAPLQVVRSFGNSTDGEWKNLIVQGDNLQFLKTCYRNVDPLIKDKVKGKVKLIYIDPPFGTGDEYGGKNSEYSYSAKLAGSEYIDSLRERLFFIHELLRNDGALFLRIDHHFSHYIKVILDEIFSKSNFQNEIMVNRIKKNVTNQGRQSIPTATDSLFVYFKTENAGFANVFKQLDSTKDGYWRALDSSGVRTNPQRVIEGKTFNPPSGRHFTFTQSRIDEMYQKGKVRIHPKTGKPQYWVEPKEQVALDTNWTDISGYTFTTGYPTENSELLLQRVLKTFISKGDLIIDFFAGSGTTGAVAEKLGCRWIMCDFGKHAIYTMQKRMLRIGESKALEEEKDSTGKVIVKQGAPYGKIPKPFSVVSTGAYDFSHIMDLRKHKETYIDFVLGLFQLARDDERAQRFRISNIYATKDGDPVEVYPVWEDEYLKHVRIDEDYLQEIIKHSGNLRGTYYIIAPESCTNVDDTVLQNSAGKDVEFKLLTFPYKVLEDVSRSLELQEQPSSPENVNSLITSTAFYFNEDVEIEIEQAGSKELRITHFRTRILDAQGNRFEGISGLAMLLIDLDYEPGKPFDMDKTVFLKEISDDWVFKIEELTKSIGIIAIDKHGNESKPYKVR